MSKLKAYRFLWRNPDTGITDRNGNTHFHPEKMVIIATSEKKARELLKKSEEEIKAIMHRRLAHRPFSEVEKLVAAVNAKDELTVREFELKNGLVI